MDRVGIYLAIVGVALILIAARIENRRVHASAFGLEHLFGLLGTVALLSGMAIFLSRCAITLP